jgi:hypothetical protein
MEAGMVRYVMLVAIFQNTTTQGTNLVAVIKDGIRVVIFIRFIWIGRLSWSDPSMSKFVCNDSLPYTQGLPHKVLLPIRLEDPVHLCVP